MPPAEQAALTVAVRALKGSPLRTLDVDVVPESSDADLQRLCDALSSLAPRWRVDDVSAGLKIDGDSLEPRHIRESSIPIGLVTRAGIVGIVMEPAGFEQRYRDLVGSAVAVDLKGSTVWVGTLDDLIVSKRFLAREKDIEHLPLLEARRAELAREHATDLDRGRERPERGKDRGMGIGFQSGEPLSTLRASGSDPGLAASDPGAERTDRLAYPTALRSTRPEN